MTSDTPHGKRVRRPPEVRRREIAEAARDVFLANGLDGARTADIARAANVTEAVLYRHFSSKEEIFGEAVLAPVERLAGELLELTGEFRDITAEQRLERSRAAHERLLGVILDIAPLIGVALFSNQAAGERFYRERLNPVFAGVARALGKAMTPRVRDVIEPRTFFNMLFGLYLATSIDAEVLGGEIDAAELASDVTNLIAFGAYTTPDDRAASQPTAAPARSRASSSAAIRRR